MTLLMDAPPTRLVCHLVTGLWSAFCSGCHRRSGRNLESAAEAAKWTCPACARGGSCDTGS